MGYGWGERWDASLGSSGMQLWGAVGCGWGQRRWCCGGRCGEAPHFTPSSQLPGLPLPLSSVPLPSEMFISNALYLHVLKHDLGRPLLVLLL